MKVINIVYCLSQNEKVNEKKEKSGRLVTLFTSNEARVSVANLQQLINCIRFRNLKCRARDRATDFQVWRLIDREFLHSSSPCSPLSPLSTSPEGSSSSFFFFFTSFHYCCFCCSCCCVLISVLFFRLWQDAGNRVYLIKELDRITGQVSN